jgi:hypothetical protein
MRDEFLVAFVLVAAITFICLLLYPDLLSLITSWIRGFNLLAGRSADDCLFCPAAKRRRPRHRIGGALQ